jgi:hypothetical protein
VVSMTDPYGHILRFLDLFFSTFNALVVKVTQISKAK